MRKIINALKKKSKRKSPIEKFPEYLRNKKNIYGLKPKKKIAKSIWRDPPT
jgi:hypothetical protein